MVALAALVASACLSAPVSYATPPDSNAPRIPWIHAGPVVGYLFYYGADGPWKTQTDRVLISTLGEASGGGVTKILWRVRGGSKTVRIVGKRLDAIGAFRQQFPATTSGGGTFFPSIINVPSSGCWRVTVSSGSHVGRFAFWAVEPWHIDAPNAKRATGSGPALLESIPVVGAPGVFQS